MVVVVGGVGLRVVVVVRVVRRVVVVGGSVVVVVVVDVVVLRVVVVIWLVVGSCHDGHVVAEVVAKGPPPLSTGKVITAGGGVIGCSGRVQSTTVG